MTPDLPESADVVIVGGGPAGLSAAIELRAGGVASVLVVDRESEAGGIPRHCNHYPYGLREFHRLMRGPEYARQLVQKAATAGVRIFTGTTVTALLPGPQLQLSNASGLHSISAKRVLLATGVRETSRAARLIGGVKPGGVISTGALQGLVYLDGLKPFQRPVILGTELVSFSAIMTCRHLGIRPIAMIEAGRRITARRPAALYPAFLGIPVYRNTTLLSIEGHSQVSAVHLCTDGGPARRLETDGVIVSGQFRPDASLLRVSHIDVDSATGGPSVDQYGRCSDPDYFAAGNLLRPVETAGWCWNEGRQIGRAIAQSLAGKLPDHSPVLSFSVGSDKIKFVLPQRLARQTSTPALPDFQLRLKESARGQITAVSDNTIVAETAINTVPERRITHPLSLIPSGLTGMLEFNLREKSE
ncbi:MAG: FAD-dependent oxidoreductase [Gammaproteobacteria bacterium]|nr:FAD-dependent oxidoreductase [Gammaproteobacteria bacterium]